MKLIYLAGKLSGKTIWEREKNIREAEEAALRIMKKLDVAVFCPHTQTRFYGDEMEWQEWIDRDLEVLKRCDAIYFVGDYWRDSKGAMAEYQFALRQEIPIFESYDMLKYWLTEGAGA